MNPNFHICQTNLLNQKQRQEIANLTAICCAHDQINLSYPFEEEDLTHLLAYLSTGQLVACLTLIPYEEDLAECCAFTHPDFRRQGYFSQLLEKSISQFPDTDLLFAVSESCLDTQKTLEALGAEKDSEEYMMERTLHEFDKNNLHFLSADFTLCQTNASEFALYKKEILCGTVCAQPVSETSVCLHHVEILPTFRGQGCGTAFLHLLFLHLASHGIKHILLHVAGDNTPAIALYKKTGFSITKTLSYYLY